MAQDIYSLTFLCAQQLVQDEEATCKILESLPQVVYNILFNVAFRNNKTNLLCELVKMWPSSQLKFQMLLQTCWCYSQTSRNCQRCQQTLSYNELSKNGIDAIMLGVISYIKNENTDASQQLPYRRLRQLDMTGLFGSNYTWSSPLMKLWSSSITRAKRCNYLPQKIQDPENQARNHVAEGSPATTLPTEAHVELLVDLQLFYSPKQFLKEALLANTYSPLHLICRDFYTVSSLIYDVVEILALLDPLALRRVDLSRGILILMDIRCLMSQIATFQNLESLKFPHFNENMQRGMHPMLKTNIDVLAAELSQLSHLKEIALHGIYLSDQVEYLLRNLQCSLESLQLSYCNLINKDLIYLAQSHHSSHLIKLDLTGNNLTKQLPFFLELLKSVSNSLKWLNVARCGIKDTDFYEILPYLYSCTRLSHLGLSHNPLTSMSMFLFLESCQRKMPNLKLISVSVFLDCCKNLPRRGPLPWLLEDYLDTDQFLSVLREMKQIQITRGDSAIELITNLNFDRGDYFDLR